MFQLQFSDKLYDACGGINPKLLKVDAVPTGYDSVLDVKLTIDVDQTPIVINMLGGPHVEEYEELIKHLGEFITLRRNSYHVYEIEAFSKLGNYPDETVVSEKCADTHEVTQPTPKVDEPNKALPEAEHPEYDDKTKQAGTPSQTKGCAFRNRSFE